MLDEGMLDIELLNFDYKQIDINNITIDMTTKVTTDNVTEQAIQRSVLSVTYVSNKFNLVETLYQQGLDPIITHTNNLTITKINQRTDQMIGPYIAIYLNNETTPRNFLLAPVETENVISKVPQPTE
jgi:hypothetical protein